MSISIGGLDYGLPQCKECGIYSLSVRMGRCDVCRLLWAKNRISGRLNFRPKRKESEDVR